MNRNQSPWGTREVHGRVQWATPLTMPIIDATDFVDRHARGKLWRKRVAMAAWVVFGALVVATVLGCATAPRETGRMRGATSEKGERR